MRTHTVSATLEPRAGPSSTGGGILVARGRASGFRVFRFQV